MGMHYDIAAIKSAIPLSEVIGIDVGWDARKSAPTRGDFWAPCPFHQERTPSFHVDDRKGFYYCFGCSASGDHVSWCQQFHGDDFPRALERLAGLAGVSPEMRQRQARPQRPAAPRFSESERQQTARRWRLACDIWHAAAPRHPLLIDYLDARGVEIAALERTWGGAPSCLRLHPDLACRNNRGEVIHRGPAMIGLISRFGEIAGIHRTWITAQGRARNGDGTIPKQWLGWTGRIHGVPVRFTAHTRRMVVGEGIETVLAWWSRAQLLWLGGHGPKHSAEAALSLGALTGRALAAGRGPASPHTGRPLSSAMPDMSPGAWGWRAPDFVDHLVVLGEGSAKDPAEAARRGWCAQRRHSYRADGTARRCELILPEGGWGSGCDFADAARQVRGRA